MSVGQKAPLPARKSPAYQVQRAEKTGNKKETPVRRLSKSLPMLLSEVFVFSTGM